MLSLGVDNQACFWFEGWPSWDEA